MTPCRRASPTVAWFSAKDNECIRQSAPTVPVTRTESAVRIGWFVTRRHNVSSPANRQLEPSGRTGKAGECNVDDRSTKDR